MSQKSWKPELLDFPQQKCPDFVQCPFGKTGSQCVDKLVKKGRAPFELRSYLLNPSLTFPNIVISTTYLTEFIVKSKQDKLVPF